jgi:hypothetical protein
MDWAVVREQLEPAFRRTIAAVGARYPDIVAKPSWIGSGWKFRNYVVFMYDPARQRYEDLMLDFWVHPVADTCSPVADTSTRTALTVWRLAAATR